MRSVLALSLCACNSTFGLHDTQRRDGAPSDAPFSCPMINTTPTFSPVVHHYSSQPCMYYAQSAAGTAGAVCAKGTAQEIWLGPIDGDLRPVGLPSFSPPDAIFNMQLSPEGDEITGLFYRNNNYELDRYRLVNGTWSFDTVLPFVAQNGIYAISIPTARTVSPRHLIFLDDNNSQLTEYLEINGTWMIGPSYTATDLNVTSLAGGVWLSRDGQRMVFGAFIGNNQVLAYTDRGDVGLRFRPADVLMTAPIAVDPYLDENCAKLFVSGLGSIFYAQPL